MMQASFVIIGGGIAGMTCAEQVFALAPEESVILITASPVVKTVSNVSRLTRHLESFDVSEQPAEEVTGRLRNLTVVRGYVEEIDVDAKVVRTKCGKEIGYERVCVTTGGAPKMIAKDHSLVLGIRDTESVRVLQEKLKGARRIMIVGNGGIATELVYELEGLEIVWAIKHKSITATFVDPGAAEFFMSRLDKTPCEDSQEVAKPKRTKYTVATGDRPTDSSALGSALGPDWHRGVELQGRLSAGQRKVILETECSVEKFMSPEEYSREPGDKNEESEQSWPLFVRLTNGKTYGVDVVISATGVEPVVPNIKSKDGKAKLDICTADKGILVNDRLASNLPHVYAAGDACTPNWELPKHWFQMRLWSQARTMGAYVGRSMLADLHGEENALMEFAFEIFAHVTQFFGYKVVFLGLFNGQGLGTDYEVLLRVTRGVEFVKVVLQDGKMQGALLIGDTGLEETFENLILNQLDLTPYGEDLLDPNIDIEDYFD